MKKVLIYGPFDQAKKAEFQNIADCIFPSPSEFTTELLQSVDGVIGNLPVSLLETAPNLEFIQLTSSGADAYAGQNKIPAETVITTATGSYGIGIAEYMVAMLLNMMKKVPAYLDDQKAAVWKDEGVVTTPMGKRVLIIGTGNIGTEFAKRMRAFGATLVGMRRRAGACPAEYDEICTIDQLKEELPKADVIALSLPGTPETRHLFDSETMKLCKKGAYLMNVGRGNVIPMETLLDPSVTERFGGIWVDVCETEPLPEGHPLFHASNVLLTPHITGGNHLDVTIQNIFDICMYNMKAWINGGEYRSVLDRETGYCK